MSALEIALEKWAVHWLMFQPGVMAVRKDGRRGWPDRQVFYGNGRHAWLEFKAAKGHMTPAQKRVIPKLIEAGETVIMAKTQDDVKRAYYLRPED